MGFFSSLSDIYKNRNNFKQWEQQERDNDAKRKALYERGVGKERLDEAKKRGDVIIDVITQMDQHSENVSEDVEQAAQVASSFAIMPAYIAGLAAMGGLGWKYTTTYNKVVEEFKKTRNLDGILEELQNAKYANQADKTRLNIPNSMHLLNSKRLSKYKKYLSQESLEKVSQYTKDWAKTAKPYKKYLIGSIVALPLIVLSTFVTSIMVGTKMQIEGSRVARWQARENLKDAKNFVVYTPNQIAQAKENLAKKPQKPESAWSKIFGKQEKNNTGFWVNWKNLLRDRAAYKQWKATDTQEKIETPLNDKEIQNAKLDKELIQRITKKINNKAEEYSENMETAATTVLGSSIIGGAAIGGALGWLLEKTGLGEKIAYRKLEKATSKDIVDKVKTLNAADMPDYVKNAKFKALKKEIAECVKEKYIPKNKNVKLGFAEIINELKASWNAHKVSQLATKAGRIKHMGKLIGIVSTLVGGFLALGWQKDAARAGRYIARQEFKDNPQEFLSYTDEEMQQVADVKGNKSKSLGQKFNEWITFVPNCIKQIYRYKNYKKTELKQQQDLQEELVKLDVSDKQLQDAKNLQRKLYNTFEVIDDKSQEYSENMEAANEMAQPVIMYGAMGTFFLPLIVAGIGAATGKISTTKLVDWGTNLLSKFSGITKSNMFKRHILEMGEQANQIIDKVDVKSTEEFAQDILNKIILKRNDGSINKFIKELGFTDEMIDQIQHRFILDESQLRNLLTALKVDTTNMSALELTRTADDLIAKGIVKAINNWKTNIAPKIITGMKSVNMTEALKGLNIESINIRSEISNLAKDEATIARVNTWLENNQFGNVQNGKIDKKFVEKLLTRYDKIAKDFPTGEVETAIKSVLAHAMENPEKFIKLMMENPSELAQCYQTPMLKKVLIGLGITWGAFTTLITYLLASYFASMQKDAGRLGVMKAIENLEDYRYYADEKSPNNENQKVEVATTKKVEQTTQPASKYPTTNWLSKYKS